MTSKEFDLVAQLLKSRDPVISGVRLVFFKKVTNAEAARKVGVTPQALHRSAKRLQSLHNQIVEAYQQQWQGQRTQTP